MSDTQNPTPGRIVRYVLNGADVAAINAAPGRNLANPGDVLPAIVVRDWGTGLVNLQVFIDGHGTHWATSRAAGSGLGQWHWPARD